MLPRVIAFKKERRLVFPGMQVMFEMKLIFVFQITTAISFQPSAISDLLVPSG